MKYLRYLLIVLVIGLALFFNIERLDFGRENIIDIDSFAYVLGAIAVISILSISIFWRSHIAISLLFWISLYLISKLALFERPLLGGLYTYLSITEITFLAIAIWLSHRLARAIGDFEDAVEHITLSSNSRIRQLSDATENIQAEMFRSRHNQHSLGVVVVEPELESVQASLQRAVQEVQRMMLDRYIVNNLARELSHYLRRIDLVLEERDRKRFIVLCPEISAEDLGMLCEYIQSIAVKKLGISVACGAATFPNEALTFEELVHRAEARIQHLKLEMGAQPQFSINGKNAS